MPAATKSQGNTHFPTEKEQAPAPADFLKSNLPEISTVELSACPVCDGSQFGHLAGGYDYELQTCRNPWRFVRCASCGHVWLNPRPCVSALPVIYPKTYYAYNYEQQINSVARRAKEILDRAKMRGIRRRCPTTPRSYLDIGCGNGRFLRLMEKYGIARDRLYGLELDEGVVARLSSEGFQASCVRVEDCNTIPEHSIELATMFHVIEHVESPRDVIGKVAEWLSPGGIFAVETPNIDSLDARLFGRSFWGGYHIPRHWHLFTPQSLARVLTDQGLEVIGTHYQTGHSFWMYSFHHWLKYGPRPGPGLAKWFDPFQGLPLLALFTAFDKLRASLGFRTSAMLMLARKPLA